MHPFRRTAAAACAAALAAPLTAPSTTALTAGLMLSPLSTTARAADASAIAPATERALRAALDDSAAGWSAGDLDRFMRVYEDAPGTTYVGSSGVVRGKAAIQAMYAERFGQGGPGTLGTLSFELLDLRPLGPQHALVIGRYLLKLPDASKPPATGLFSLVFHHSTAGWRVVADHSS